MAGVRRITKEITGVKGLTIRNIQRSKLTLKKQHNCWWRTTLQLRSKNSNSENQYFIILTSDICKTIVHPQNVITKEGGNFIIYCNATGNPEPTIFWIKDGFALRNNSRIISSADNKQLTITNAAASDSGEYRCVAMNKFESFTSIACTVDVQGKSFFVYVLLS